ncbi:jasmonate-induced protein [Striga asiatica]|uniref:Jasmonate-induced protein n=1 Tax=Striga asiatica TaxID=4170 RepID=A0A5A7PHJ0_STRAF|nr:jasmonate-induced protein [Striga asiatica]
MAVNVFGNPVTDDTVRLIFPNIINPTPVNRAEAALHYMNAENKADNASTFVHNTKEAYGNGTSTLGMFYNATGGPLYLQLTHDWEGSVWRSPIPQVVQNGQWAAFLHVRYNLMGASKAAMVYRGQINNGLNRDWMICFNTSRRHFQNRVYAEIRVQGGFNSVNWGTISNNMERQENNFTATQNGGAARVSIGSGSSPEFVGIMTLEGVTPRAMELADNISAISPSLDSKYDETDATAEGEEGDTPAAPTTAADTTAPTATTTE